MACWYYAESCDPSLDCRIVSQIWGSTMVVAPIVVESWVWAPGWTHPPSLPFQNIAAHSQGSRSLLGQAGVVACPVGVGAVIDQMFCYRADSVLAVCHLWKYTHMHSLYVSLYNNISPRHKVIKSLYISHQRRWVAIIIIKYASVVVFAYTIFIHFV